MRLFKSKYRKAYDGFIVNIKSSQPNFGFDLSHIKLKTRKDAVLRNCVDPEIGLMILNCARNKESVKQKTLFSTNES